MNSCLSFVSGQSGYVPLPDSDAVWRVDYYSEYWCPGQFGDPYRSYQYSIEGDTMINDTLYHKIFKSGKEHCFNNTSYFNYYYGAIRQEVDNKKVFFLSPFTNDVDTLLYNFNLSVGDTLPETFLNFGHFYVIESVDSVLFDGIYHKVYYWNNAPVLMEGVGNVRTGFLEHLELTTEPEAWIFICFRINGAFAYGDTAKCSIVTMNEEVHAPSPDMSLSPNPAESSVNISCSIEQNATLTFTNAYGSVVKQFPLLPHFSNRMVYVDDLPEGVYLVTLHAPDKILSKKILVVR